jgi:prevent-host-death family protein
MLNVDYTTLREIQRNPKKVSEEVNKEDKPFIVMSNNKPQFAIVSLKLFSQIQKPHEKDETTSLLGLLEWADKKDLDLPSDLSEKHDEYLWEKPREEK